MKARIVGTVAICLGLSSTPALADETVEAPASETNSPCISTDPSVSDSSKWAITAVEQFANKQYSEAVATVDACFDQWAPAAGQQQKVMHDNNTACPNTGNVGKRDKRKIDANGLLNDASMALWAKARSLHELGDDDAALTAYGQCVYMSCGRAWDPGGWYWSPAKDCAEQVQPLLK